MCKLLCDKQGENNSVAVVVRLAFLLLYFSFGWRVVVKSLIYILFLFCSSFLIQPG